MELDHFRPKAEALFPELEDEPTNLVLSCRSCNGKKRDDWPAGKTKGKTHVGGYGYIDPFKVQRSLYFEVVSNGELRGKKAPAAYVIEHLSLNRPFAMAVRARRVLRVRLHQAIDSLASDLKALDGQPNRPGQLTQIASLLEQANRALCKLELEDAAPL